MEPVKAAIICYSATGTVHPVAQAAAEGAEKAGAHVRPHKVYPAFTASNTPTADRSPPWQVADHARTHLHAG